MPGGLCEPCSSIRHGGRTRPVWGRRRCRPESRSAGAPPRRLPRGRGEAASPGLIRRGLVRSARAAARRAADHAPARRPAGRAGSSSAARAAAGRVRRSRRPRLLRRALAARAGIGAAGPAVRSSAARRRHAPVGLTGDARRCLRCLGPAHRGPPTWRRSAAAARAHACSVALRTGRSRRAVRGRLGRRGRPASRRSRSRSPPIPSTSRASVPHVGARAVPSAASSTPDPRRRLASTPSDVDAFVGVDASTGLRSSVRAAWAARRSGRRRAAGLRGSPFVSAAVGPLAAGGPGDRSSHRRSTRCCRCRPTTRRSRRLGRGDGGRPGRRRGSPEPGRPASVVHDDAASRAVLARLGERLEQARPDALAGHLHQAERGDLGDLVLGAVAAQALDEPAQHEVAVGLEHHVDEVDDDDAADVAQPQLADDLLGRLEVVLGDGLLEVAARADELAGVDVDDRHRLGAVDDERAARRQPHLAVHAPWRAARRSGTRRRRRPSLGPASSSRSTQVGRDRARRTR